MAGASLLHGVCAESISGDETARWELVPGAPGRAGHSCTSRSLLVPERHWLQGLVPQPEGKDLLKAEAWRLSLAVTHQSSRVLWPRRPRAAHLRVLWAGPFPHREFSLMPGGWNSSDLPRCSPWPHFLGAGRGGLGWRGNSVGTEVGIKELTPSRRGPAGPPCAALKTLPPPKAAGLDGHRGRVCPVSLLPLGPIPELLNPWESGTFGSLGWEGTGRAGREPGWGSGLSGDQRGLELGAPGRCATSNSRLPACRAGARWPSQHHRVGVLILARSPCLLLPPGQGLPLS